MQIRSGYGVDVACLLSISLFISNFLLGGSVIARWLVPEVFGKYSELFLEAFGKIGRGVKSDDITYLIDFVLLRLDELGCHFQTFQLNEFVRGNLGNAFYFTVQTGPAHIHFLGQYIYVEFGFGDITFNDLSQFLQKASSALVNAMVWALTKGDEVKAWRNFSWLLRRLAIRANRYSVENGFSI